MLGRPPTSAKVTSAVGMAATGTRVTNRNLPLLALFLILLVGTVPCVGGTEETRIYPKAKGFEPEFSDPIVNLTVPVGRDATFRCLLHHLGGYRVGWVKADTKAIQAIHDHVITHNPRISVSHTDHTTWNLHLHNVQQEDAGVYMCQINTDPMKSQLGSLKVVVPPDFISEETSGDLMVPEGGIAKLVCKASGLPQPHIQWRREDGGDIIIRGASGQRTRVTTYPGDILKLPKVSRSEMGAYLCIASNGVPPTISKRIIVSVHFHPVIQVPNQLVGAPLRTDVTLECFVEASPRSISYWMKGTSEMVISSNKYDVKITTKSLFESHMTVTIRNLRRGDMGSYRCIAKNSIGEVESNIRLYEIPGPTRNYNLPVDEEDYGEQFGSAEKEQDEVLPKKAVNRGGLRRRRPSSRLTSGSPKATYKNKGNHVPQDQLSKCNSTRVKITVIILSILLILFAM